jgi:hypothetical protein
VFGIQSRGGCSCAGPYGHRLLGIDIERSHQFEREIAFDPASGLWRHRHGPVEPPLRLGELRYDGQGRLRFAPAHAHAEDSALPGYLDQARRLLATRPAPAEDGPAALPGLSDDFETLRRFVLPPECLPG